MSLAVSSERTHCSVGPRRAQMDATVVPQEPPPRTTTLGSRFSADMGISVLHIWRLRRPREGLDNALRSSSHGAGPVSDAGLRTNYLSAWDFGPYSWHGTCR